MKEPALWTESGIRLHQINSNQNQLHYLLVYLSTLCKQLTNFVLTILVTEATIASTEPVRSYDSNESVIDELVGNAAVLFLLLNTV